MMPAQTLLLFTGATLLIAVSPGPNTFLVISQTLTSGPASASQTIVGLALSSVVYLAATVTGLAALMNAWPLVFSAIRLAGVVYLGYLGIRMVLSAGVRHDTEPRPGLDRSPVLQGFITGFSNPKAILYWSAFLPQFVDRAQPGAPQLVILGIIGTMLEVVVLLTYTFIVVRSRERLISTRFTRTTDRLAGCYFIGIAIFFGAMLARRTAP